MRLNLNERRLIAAVVTSFYLVVFVCLMPLTIGAAIMLLWGIGIHYRAFMLWLVANEETSPTTKEGGA